MTIIRTSSFLGGIVEYSIQPGAIHAIVVDVAADGQALQQAGTDTSAIAEELAGSFGTAAAVAGAFEGFWSARREVAPRIASLLFRKTTAVADAAQAFIDADGEMTAAVRAATATLPTYYAPADRPRPGRLRFLEQ